MRRNAKGKSRQKCIDSRKASEVDSKVSHISQVFLSPSPCPSVGIFFGRRRWQFPPRLVPGAAGSSGRRTARATPGRCGRREGCRSRRTSPGSLHRELAGVVAVVVGGRGTSSRTRARCAAEFAPLKDEARPAACVFVGAQASFVETELSRPMGSFSRNGRRVPQYWVSKKRCAH